MTRSRTAQAAACTALPATTVVRDAQEPTAERLQVGVPADHADRVRVDAEGVGGDLGQHGLDALAQRRAAGQYTCTAPPLLTSTSAVSCGPSPLFSRNMATPSPRSRPARRPGVDRGRVAQPRGLTAAASSSPG